VPSEIKMLIDYINEGEDISLELENQLTLLNTHLQKGTQDELSQIQRWSLRNSFYKWFLIKSSSLEKSKNIIPIKKPLSVDFSPYEQWIYKNIHTDIENILVKYSRKKVNYSDLSKIAQKKMSLLNPWVGLFRRNTMPKMLREELLPLTLEHLEYINKQISAFNIISSYSQKNTNSTIYISKADSINKVIPEKINSDLPTPVDDWGNQDRYNKKKSSEVDKDGLPLPVDDWILDF
jgi:hypothetical protein